MKKYHHSDFTWNQLQWFHWYTVWKNKKFTLICEIFCERNYLIMPIMQFGVVNNVNHFFSTRLIALSSHMKNITWNQLRVSAVLHMILKIFFIQKVLSQMYVTLSFSLSFKAKKMGYQKDYQKSTWCFKLLFLPSLTRCTELGNHFIIIQNVKLL